MYREWLERGPSGDATEQRICDQERVTRKNGWITEIGLEMIKKRINTTRPQETDQEENQGVEAIRKRIRVLKKVSPILMSWLLEPN